MRKLVLLAAFLLGLAACGGGGTPASDGKPKAGGTLKIAQETEIVTFDPAASGLLVEREIYYNMYESLVGIDAKLNFVPMLATEWKYTDDRTLVFTLRQGVKFQDGTPFDAEAVKFNLDRYLTDPKSVRKSDLASVQSVEVRDPTTVVFRLKRPDGTLLAQLVDRAGMILSPTAIKQLGDKLGTGPVGAGTGAFQFVEWKRDDHLTLKKNTAYWRKDKDGQPLPHLDELIYNPRTNLDAILAGLKTDEFDAARTLAFKDIEAVKTDSNLVYKDVASLGYQGFWLNASAPPFNDPAKRKAVALAVDRPQILKNVFFNLGVLSSGAISPASWAHDPSLKIYEKPDVEKAKATATGFSFTLKVATTQDAQQVGQLIQAQLAKAGITVNLQPVEFGKLTTESRAHQFEASLQGWSGRIDPDGNTFAFLRSGGSFNDGVYQNPQVDQLLDEARATTDQAKRKQLYQQVQRMVAEDAPYVYIYHPPAQQIISKKVHNFTLYPDQINRYIEVWKE